MATHMEKVHAAMNRTVHPPRRSFLVAVTALEEAAS